MLKLVHISGIEDEKPKKLTAKQQFVIEARILRRKMELRDQKEAEKCRPQLRELAKKIIKERMAANRPFYLNSIERK